MTVVSYKERCLPVTHQKRHYQRNQTTSAVHGTLPILKAQIYKAETLLQAVFKNRYRRRRLPRGGCCVVVKGYKAAFTQLSSIATKLT